MGVNEGGCFVKKALNTEKEGNPARPHKENAQDTPGGNFLRTCCFVKTADYRTISSLGDRVMSWQPSSSRISTSSMRTPKRPGR